MRVTVEYGAGTDRGFLLETSTTLETRWGGGGGKKGKKKAKNRASKGKWNRLQVIVPGF